MMDIDYFKETLSSISDVSGLGFAVFDRETDLFTTEDLTCNPTLKIKLASLSEKITERDGFFDNTTSGSPHIYGVPLKDGKDMMLSFMAFDKNNGRNRQHEMEAMLTNLAGIMQNHWISKAESEKMAWEIDHSFEELYLYSKIATQVKTLRFTETMQRELIDDLISIMRVDIAFTELKTHQEYNVVVTKHEIEKTVQDTENFIRNLVSMIPEHSISGDDNYFILNNSQTNAIFRNLHTKPFRFLAVKIQNNMNLDGWLGLISFNLNEIFRQSELSLLVTMAEQIAVVLSNQDLYRDLERFVINVVKSLVQAIEAKDLYTKGHSERVNNYSMMISEKLELGDSEKRALHWASILHDIGKIGIPEAILNKSDFLNDEEYSIIKKHPEKGSEILKPIEQLNDSVEGLLYHHERYDGKGYPKGLKEKEIPLAARIIAVADTFDAITTSRAYRDARTYEKAVEIIKDVAGSQLDPDIVNIMETLYRQGCLERFRA